MNAMKIGWLLRWIALWATTACSAGEAASGSGDSGGPSGKSGTGASTPVGGEAGDDAAGTVDSGIQETAVAVSVGVSSACALTSSGGVECWGSQIGSPPPGTFSSAPAPVIGLESGVIAISVGYSFACALTAGGGVQCWGDNSSGQLGNDSVLGSSAVPVPVTGLASGVTAISVGDFSACALTANGAVQCWGDNTSGQLGNDSVPGSSAVPVPVTGLASGVAAVSLGSFSACALASGGVQCWGTNYPSGGLGNNSVGFDSPVPPVPVTGLASGVTAIFVSGDSACALAASGGVQCWGNIAQLGTFVSVPSIPVPVAGLSSGVTSVSVGGSFACALTPSGVQCWGDTPVLGSYEFPTYPPVPVAGLSSGVRAVSAGRTSACALTASGGIECWGDNSNGQLGNGSTVGWSSVPVAVTGFADRHHP
ncbi:MAG TPA: hypothetical protein VN894_19650 [Polyangiaceae bacterium]|nr:hypothetical protein [Polyangiaceae bacterium]